MNILITQSLKKSDVTRLYQFPPVLMESYEVKWVDWIRNYSMKHAQPPTLKRFEKQFETFVPADDDNPLSDTYELTLAKKRNIWTRRFILAHQDEINDGEDPLPLITELYQTIHLGDADVLKYSEYDRTKYLSHRTAFPYGIKEVDKQTGGASAGDLIYLFGRLGTGKTTFALWMIKKWLQAGHRILVISNENRAEDIIAKMDAFIGGWNPIKRRLLEWTEEDKAKIRTVSHIAASLPGEVIVPTIPISDVESVQALMHTHRPDIVMIDGIYLLSENKGDSAAWEKITDVSRNLKRLADNYGVPIIGIHQANRSAIGKRVGIENIAYSDALGQDADLVLGLNEDEGGDLIIECLKNRWGKSGWGLYVRLHFDTMMVQLLSEGLIEEEDDES